MILLTWRQEGHFGVLQVPVSNIKHYIIVRHIMHLSRHLFISFFAVTSVIINWTFLQIKHLNILTHTTYNNPEQTGNFKEGFCVRKASFYCCVNRSSKNCLTLTDTLGFVLSSLSTLKPQHPKNWRYVFQVTLKRTLHCHCPVTDNIFLLREYNERLILWTWMSILWQFRN